jgi:uncharacterized membrane protein YeaQ/YmgE (transglycosylase-associated protein family)
LFGQEVNLDYIKSGEGGDVFHLFGQYFSGLIVGILAGLLMPGKNPAEIMTTPFLGLTGSVAGTWLARYFFGEQLFATWISSLVCSIMVLVIYWLAIERGPGTEDKSGRVDGLVGKH